MSSRHGVEAGTASSRARAISPHSHYLYLIVDWRLRIYGDVLQLCESNQATMQIMVQVISHILAMLQVSSICAVLNLSTRYRSLHRSTSLQDLCLWIALSTARVDLNLPTPHLLIASAFVAATLLPGALWAGALSPCLF